MSLISSLSFEFKVVTVLYKQNVASSIWGHESRAERDLLEE